MICVPPYEGKELFEYWDREIIKPANLIKDIDMEYKAKQMAKRISNNSDDDENNNDKNSMTLRMATMNDNERMKMIKKMVKNKKTEKKKISNSK